MGYQMNDWQEQRHERLVAVTKEAIEAAMEFIAEKSIQCDGYWDEHIALQALCEVMDEYDNDSWIMRFGGGGW